MAVSDGHREWLAQLRRALRFLRPHRCAILAILALTLAVAGASAVEPLVLKDVFDRVDRGESGGALGRGVATLLGLGLAIELLGGLSNWMTWRLRLDVHRELLDATVTRLYQLPPSFHHQDGVGGAMARMERSINGFLGALNQMAFGVLPSIAYLLISFAVMVRLEWRLSLVVLAFTLGPAALGAWAAGTQTLRERLLMQRWSSTFSRLYETLTGLNIVKSFGREEEERQRFLESVQGTNEVVVRGVRFDTGVGAAKNLVTMVARLTALSLGAFLVLRGETTLGTVVAFLGYIGGIFGPVQGLTAIYQTLRMASVSLETIFSLLDAPGQVKDAPVARGGFRLRGEVRFEDVSYAYGEGVPVLRGVDLHVEPGERVALVGPSGAGKSTLMWLLLRLQDPTSGVVRVDGMDLRTLEQRALRHQIGVVLQDTLLFRDTIRNNIAYGRPDASLQEVRAAAMAAHAHDFIMRLPEGYDTVVGERGATLSGGERQRIAIARALLKDPPILILDEATSNLDPEAEALVREALAQLSRGRTTFVIAHRLTMAMDADRIVVLRGGRVVEVGTHRELTVSNGSYASMIRSQLEGLLPTGSTAVAWRQATRNVLREEVRALEESR